MKIPKPIGKLAQRVIDSVTGSGLMQDETSADGRLYCAPGSGNLIRQGAAESCVLLKNDGTLPLNKAQSVAVFGRCQLDWFYVGYGSGGDVHAPYYVNLIDGLKNAGAAYDKTLATTYRAWCSSKEHKADHGWWGHWPMSHPEMPLTPAMVHAARRGADTALVVIGRAAGEDRENTLTPGSYYLTDAERAMLDAVTEAFDHTVVILNAGSVFDLRWTEDYGEKLSAVLFAWLGGMESGNGVADVLYGAVSPSGRLADTIARHYEDYPSSANFGGKEFNDYAEGIFVGYRHFETFAPEKVLYPFGFGLSYTTFDVSTPGVLRTKHGAEASVTVRNTGDRAGKEVVQLWCSQPDGRMEKAKRILVAFGKTKTLAPGEAETLRLTCLDKDYASYDEQKHAFVLEAGEYVFKVNDTEAGVLSYETEVLVEQCEDICLDSAALRERILARLPQPVRTEHRALHLREVAAGRREPEDFVRMLSDEELEALTRGHGMMNSSLGVSGNAGAIAGIVPSLRFKGVPALITADGPAGLRLARHASLAPCGTAMACTWNTALISEIYAKVGEEMTHYGVDIHLGPGMNIHRNPLCGRNFEYFSEDPLLSGKMGAAMVRGVQSTGHASCPKHFACNNQEVKRKVNDSRVSERALREIYLRNFEICVKEAKPLTLMMSYNKINGVWSHYHYDLATTVLRREWGFQGVTLTDWWMQKSKSPEFPALRNNAYRVRAQVDVLMPGDFDRTAKKYKTDPTLLETLGKPDGITRAELQRTALNVLRLVLKLRY